MDGRGGHAAALPPSNFRDEMNEDAGPALPPPTQFAAHQSSSTPPVPFGFGDDDYDSNDDGFVVVPPPPPEVRGTPSTRVAAPPLPPPPQPESGTPPASPRSAGLRAVVRQVRRRWDALEGFGFSMSGSPAVVTAALSRPNELLNDVHDGQVRAGDVLLQVNGVGCAEASIATVKHLVASGVGATLSLEVLRSASPVMGSDSQRPEVAQYSPPTPQLTPQHRQGKAPSPLRCGADPTQHSSPRHSSPPLHESSQSDSMTGSEPRAAEVEVDWDGAVVKIERRSTRTRQGSNSSLGRRQGSDRGKLPAKSPSPIEMRIMTADRRPGGPRVRRRSGSPLPQKTRSVSVGAVPLGRLRLHSIPAGGGADLSDNLGSKEWDDAGDPFNECGSDMDEIGGGRSLTSSSSSTSRSHSLELTRENLSALQKSLGGTSGEGRPSHARTSGRLSGWLYLETVPGSWTTRWCKIQAHELLLFADSLETRTLGVIGLLGAEVNAVHNVSGPEGCETFAFDTVPVCGSTVRTCTARWDERQTWMRSLRRAAVRTEDLDALSRKTLENRIEKELFDQCGSSGVQLVSVARKLSALKSVRCPVNPSVE